MRHLFSRIETECMGGRWFRFEVAKCGYRVQIGDDRVFATDVSLVDCKKCTKCCKQQR